MPEVLAKRVGFVVTPSRTPQRATVRISSMSAVSRKSFVAGWSPWRAVRDVAGRRESAIER